MKRVFIVSSGRADFYLLEDLYYKLQKKRTTFLILFGSHFMQYQDRIFFKKKIKKNLIIRIRNYKALYNYQQTFCFISDIIKKISAIFIKKKPSLLILLGDRYEVFIIAYIASIMNIPIVHIHGGEVTKGAIDDNFRHAITKMSHIHFTSTETYKKRIIQLGENKNRIFNVGSLGVENIKKTQFYSKKEIERKLKIKLKKQIFLVTYHPVTLNSDKEKIDNLLSVLQDFQETTIIFTLPNIDIKNDLILNKIKIFINNFKDSVLVRSMGQRFYFSCAKISNGVIGNSSSGIIEIPSLKIPTLNIGSRQEGRVMASSVISCKNKKKDIRNGFKKITSKIFLNNLKKICNPYYKPEVSKNIVNILQNLNYQNIINKSFNDI